MNLLRRCIRKRAYNRIRVMHNAINNARTDYRDLCSIIENSPNESARLIATQQRDTTRKQLNLMRNDILWMMRNYRAEYPKARAL